MRCGREVDVRGAARTIVCYAAHLDRTSTHVRQLGEVAVDAGVTVRTEDNAGHHPVWGGDQRVLADVDRFRVPGGVAVQTVGVVVGWIAGRAPQRVVMASASRCPYDGG